MSCCFRALTTVIPTGTAASIVLKGSHPRCPLAVYRAVAGVAEMSRRIMGKSLSRDKACGKRAPNRTGQDHPQRFVYGSIAAGDGVELGYLAVPGRHKTKTSVGRWWCTSWIGYCRGLAINFSYVSLSFVFFSLDHARLAILLARRIFQ